MGVNLMEKITSTNNQIVKNTAKLLQRKYREETEFFLVEGEKAIKGILIAGFKINSIFMEENCQEKFSQIPAQKKYLVNEAVLSKISTTKSPCNVVAVFEQKKYEVKEFLNKKRLLLLENIKDAGNLGTILRTCKAFDIDGVLLLGDTVDLYNPKVIRASVGCFDLPILNIHYEYLDLFKNYIIYSTALHENSQPLKDVLFKEPLIIAFGAEADGLSQRFLERKVTNIKIEINNSVESLNLASAVSICLYKIYINYWTNVYK